MRSAAKRAARTAQVSRESLGEAKVGSGPGWLGEPVLTCCSSSMESVSCLPDHDDRKPGKNRGE
jgi:hypothetical protein